MSTCRSSGVSLVFRGIINTYWGLHVGAKRPQGQQQYTRGVWRFEDMGISLFLEDLSPVISLLSSFYIGYHGSSARRLEGVVQDIILHLDHRGAVFRLVHLRSRSEEDILDDTLAGRASCNKRQG